MERDDKWQARVAAAEPAQPPAAAEAGRASGNGHRSGRRHLRNSAPLPVAIGMLANVATALAVVLAVLQMRAENERLARQAHFDIYNELNSQYVDLLQACIAHPTVDFFDRKLPQPQVPTSEAELRTEQASFLALISLLERAWVFYQRDLQPDDAWVKAQWPGWKDYAHDFATRSRFLETWEWAKTEFDSGFVAWMEPIVDAAAGG